MSAYYEPEVMIENLCSQSVYKIPLADHIVSLSFGDFSNLGFNKQLKQVINL